MDKSPKSLKATYFPRSSSRAENLNPSLFLFVYYIFFPECFSEKCAKFPVALSWCLNLSSIFFISFSLENVRISMPWCVFCLFVFNCFFFFPIFHFSLKYVKKSPVLVFKLSVFFLCLLCFFWFLNFFSIRLFWVWKMWEIPPPWCLNLSFVLPDLLPSWLNQFNFPTISPRDDDDGTEGICWIFSIFFFDFLCFLPALSPVD